MSQKWRDKAVAAWEGIEAEEGEGLAKQFEECFGIAPDSVFALYGFAQLGNYHFRYLGTSRWSITIMCPKCGQQDECGSAVDLVTAGRIIKAWEEAHECKEERILTWEHHQDQDESVGSDGF